MENQVTIKRVKNELVRLNMASGRIRDRLYGEHNTGKYDGSTAQRAVLAAQLREIRHHTIMIAKEMGLEL